MNQRLVGTRLFKIDLFKKRLLILTSFLSRDKHFELEVLCGLQNVNTDFDDTFLADLFRIIYDQKILNERTFISWQIKQRLSTKIQNESIKSAEQFFETNFSDENSKLKALPKEYFTYANLDPELVLIFSCFNDENATALTSSNLKVNF